VSETAVAGGAARTKQRHVICAGEDLPPGAVRTSRIDGVEIGVLNVAGTIHAMRNVCPHAQAPICRGAVTGTLLPSEVGTFDFGMENQVIRCPWHRFQYDLHTGRPLTGVGGRLRLYEARIEDDEVVVYL
jgi:nitrite reductase (NADH) small subunit